MTREDLDRTTARPMDSVLSPGIAGGRRRKAADSALLDRLIETGFLASEFGLNEQAEIIFQCLIKLRPGKPAPYIALAIVRARRGTTAQGIATLQEVLEQYPDSEMARAVLGAMLMHSGDSEGRVMLEDVIARASDEAAVNVAISYRDLGIERVPAQPSSLSSAEYFRHYNLRL